MGAASGRRDAGSQTVVEVVVSIFAVAEVRVCVFIAGARHDAAVGRVVAEQGILGRCEPRPQGSSTSRIQY